MQPTNIKQIDQQLASIYNPQIKSVKQKMAALPGYYKPQIEGLKQAKVNAFRDIANTANASGMLFSGFTPAEQARYTGERYLPALAGLKQQENEERLSLVDVLNNLVSERRGRAFDIRESRIATNLEHKRWQREMAENRRQFDISTDLDRAKIAASSSSSAGSQFDYANALKNSGYAASFKTDEDGQAKPEWGLQFSDPTGRPISMAVYSQSTGIPMMQVLADSPSDYDQKAYATARKLAQQGKSETKIESTLRDKFPLLF